MASRTSTNRVSPWMLERPIPRTRTRPPQTAAAAKKYDAPLASGSMS
jgi:hypothetical protein